MKILINHLPLFKGAAISAHKKHSLFLCVSVLKPLLLILTFTTITFSQSIINYQTGTTIEVQTGATVCADSAIISGMFTGGGTVCGLLYTLNLKIFIEGFYNPVLNTMVSDTVRVYIRNSASPYSLIDSSIAVIDPSGNGEFHFANTLNGVNYYLDLKHRNSVETWCKTTQTFSANTLAYNFTTADTQAFGNNLINVDASPVSYAVYSGDVNQDGVIDIADGSLIDNDAFNFNSGYLPTDVNGDGVIDLADAVFADNNGFNFVGKITP